MKTKFDQLLEFPCSFTFKIMGDAKPELVNEILCVIQKYAPGDYSPLIKPSSTGKYYSISVTINASDSAQIETLYQKLGEIESVKMVL